jgi:hypothetical protein
MFPKLRAVQIEVPGDVLEMREGTANLLLTRQVRLSHLSAATYVKTNAN